LRGGDEGEGGAASEIFRVYNQAFLQPLVTLSHTLPPQGGGRGLNIILSPLRERAFNPHKSLKSQNIKNKRIQETGVRIIFLLNSDFCILYSLSHIHLSLHFHLSAPEEIEEKSQDEADDNTGDNGEVELKVLPFDYDISWQSPNEWNLRHHGEEQSHQDKNHTREY
jgi:hypothetical protein